LVAQLAFLIAQRRRFIKSLLLDRQLLDHGHLGQALSPAADAARTAACTRWVQLVSRMSLEEGDCVDLYCQTARVVRAGATVIRADRDSVGTSAEANPRDRTQIEKCQRSERTTEG
jgi:hypothetical protein